MTAVAITPVIIQFLISLLLYVCNSVYRIFTSGATYPWRTLEFNSF
jgi:hypothetical protein